MTPRDGPAGESFRDERKVVTTLFADVAGSTSMGEQLEPEEFRLVIGEAIDQMGRIVEAYGGHVNDVSGDGLLAIFGAPTVHEDDAERAIRAALEVSTAMSRYGSEVEQAWDIESFAVRVGVCTGPVVVGLLGGDGAADYTAHGDAVNTAARLQSAAEPGAILVDAVTRRLSEDLFRWEAPRTLSVKGKAETVTASRVLGYSDEDALTAEFVPLWCRLVGRATEMARLEEVRDGLRRGIGRILFIVGEAGIGKSRLVDELHGLTGDDGRHPRWLLGQAASYGEATPYWPFRDMLRRWLGVTFDEPDLRVRVRLRKEVTDLFGERTMEIYPYLASMLALTLEPDVRRRLDELSPEALQYRTFEVMGELTRRLAEDGPVVMAVEDLHWADPTSGQLLESLLVLCEQAPVVIVATIRPEPDHHSWELRTGAAREFPHSIEELTLEALTGRADEVMLRHLVGEEVLPAELERSILQVAEGNPFFLEELIRSLVDAGALVSQGNGFRLERRVPFELPPTVERVILARIDRLPEVAHDVLVGASVLGRQFSLPLLAAVTSEEEPTLRRALHDLQRLDFIRLNRRFPQPDYQFKHALIQEAAYRTLLKSDRVSRHQAAARYVEERYEANQDEVLGLLAYHWHAAGVEDKAIDYLARAGDKARLEYSLDEAVDHYRRLLPLLEKREDRAGAALVLFKLALALHMALRFAEANDAYQRAFDYWEDPPPWQGAVDAVLRVGGSNVTGPDPRSHYLGDVRLCMAIYDRLVEAWPERTIVPSLAERWVISDDGLRYRFHLRPGLTWGDGTPLTAHDFEYGIKRVVDPRDPGMSVAIYFVLEAAQGYFLEEHSDPDRIGVRALDDHTLEFRLVAPAPYFMWVVNRPDAGPQPRHAFEAGMSLEQVADEVANGSFSLREMTESRLLLERRTGYGRPRRGNVARVEWHRDMSGAEEAYLAGDLDIVESRLAYLPQVDARVPEQGRSWPPAWTSYLVFDHDDPVASQRDFRLALAHSIDRDRLAEAAPPPWTIATGGLVPPPLQGHTPDISPDFDPDLARDLVSRVSGLDSTLDLAYPDVPHERRLLDLVIAGWKEVLGLEVEQVRISLEEIRSGKKSMDGYPISLSGWYPGYPDPEYYLRLLLQSDSHTNQGGFADPIYDALIEEARQERRDRRRLELFHQADRRAVADRVAVIPLWYASNVTYAKPGVGGWWEFGKSWPNFADLTVEPG